MDKETVKKHYFVDNGLLNLFLVKPDTMLLENIVAVALHKRYGDNLYYYNKNVEVDFYIPDEAFAVQVCYDLTEEQTLQREVNALLRLKKSVGLERMLIITRDEERMLEFSGEKIEAIPVWRWLLS